MVGKWPQKKGVRRPKKKIKNKIFFNACARHFLRQPGIEPGPHRWQRRILTTELLAHIYIY
jgi:hypothetical protein